MQAVSVTQCRYRTQNEVSQQFTAVHQLWCFNRRLSWVFRQRRHAHLARPSERFRSRFGLGHQLQEQKVGPGKQKYENFCTWSQLRRSSFAVHRHKVSLLKGNRRPDPGKHLHQHQRNDPCNIPSAVSFHLPAAQLLAVERPSSAGQAAYSLHQIAPGRNSADFSNGAAHQQRN